LAKTKNEEKDKKTWLGNKQRKRQKNLARKKEEEIDKKT
jgi:hypothetical protein